MTDIAHRHRTTQKHAAVASQLVVARTDTTAAVQLRVEGEIDLASASILADQLQRAINDNDRPVIVDLSTVTFMDCSGVHTLVTAQQAAQGRVRLAHPQRAVRRVLELGAVLELFAPADEPAPP
jgi:anti-sigma B factor antagonist